jgi:hypothetical protein
LFDDFRERVDVMKGRRIVTAFAREMMFNQAKWRRDISDFDEALTACSEPLCAAFRARVAYEYDAVLCDLERIAERSESIHAILGVVVAVTPVETRPIRCNTEFND